MQSDSQYYVYKRNNLYFSLFVSLFLMLFLVGAFGVLLINGEYLNRYFKEKFTLTVYYKSGTARSEIKKDEKRLKADTLVREVVFISKERAAQKAKQILGQDFVAVLGENPLQDNLEIHFKAPYVDEQIIKRFKDRLMQNPHVDEVSYEKTVLELLTRNLRKIGMITLGFAVIFLFVILYLIKNTVKLSLYSKRHLIKTMQLVGASEGFIMRPFLLKNMLIAAVSGLLAALGVWYLLEWFANYLGGLNLGYVRHNTMFWLLLLWITGIFFTLITTYFSARRILRMREEEIHF